MDALVENTPKKVTAEAYLQMEENSSVKHHFINGEIIAMPGATPVHNLIAGNLITQLNIELEKISKTWFVLTSDTKVYIPRLHRFLYPDAVVVCEEIQLYPGSNTVVTNPLLIIEVLSPSTASQDRNETFFDYKRIPSFREYILVEQALPFVTASFKTGERTWADTEADGLDAAIYLQSIGCSIDLKKIYRGVVF